MPITLIDAVVEVPSGLTSVMTAIWAAVGQVVTNIIASPLLLIGVTLGFAGSAVGLAKRLMGTKRRRR